MDAELCGCVLLAAGWDRRVTLRLVVQAPVVLVSTLESEPPDDVR